MHNSYPIQNMKKFLILLLCLSCIIACNNKAQDAGGKDTKSSALTDENYTDAEGWKFDTLSIARKVHIDNDTAKDGMQINLSFIYPVSVPANLNLSEVQNTFSRVFLWEQDFTGTPDEAFQKEIDKYVKAAEEKAVFWKDWEAGQYIPFSGYEDTKVSQIESDTEYVVTISLNYYSYEGGAHGMHGLHYFNIDKRSGTLITEEELFKPGYENRVAALIQQDIEKVNSSPDEDSHIGLLVELSEIKPNRNFLLSPAGMTYVYNIYEIAPYVQGPVEAVVPYEELMTLVNEKYLPVIQSLNEISNNQNP